MEKEQDNIPFWRCDNPILWGIIVSCVILGLSVLLAFQPICEYSWSYAVPEYPVQTNVCITKWRHFANASPNENGDTLAGIAGSLAFVWIVATIVLQAQKLRAQREEFAKMSSAQDKQAEMMQVQSEIFKDEQRQRLEMRTGEEVAQKIELAAQTIQKLHSVIDWSREVNKSLNFPGATANIVNTKIGVFTTDLLGPTDAIIRASEQDILRFLKLKENPDAKLTGKSVNKEKFVRLLSQMEDIYDLHPHLSKAEILRLEVDRVDGLHTQIELLIAADIWLNPDKKEKQEE